MKKKLYRHSWILVLLTLFMTFVASSIFMYEKTSLTIRQQMEQEALFLQEVLNQWGTEQFQELIGESSQNRITLIDVDGTVIYDSWNNSREMENHSQRPEIITAREEGIGYATRHSKTISKDSVYVACLLENGQIIRVGDTQDNVWAMMISGSWILLLVIAGIFVINLLLINGITKQFVEPLNQLDLDHPVQNIPYEEIRPLLERMEQQRTELQEQLMMRQEFSANVSHELKTPLMSISGYAELIKNHMVQEKDIPEFAGRIYQEAARLSALVEDIIRLSKLDNDQLQLEMEQIDLYEMTEDIMQSLQMSAQKKQITLQLAGEHCQIYGMRQIIYEMLYNLCDNAICYNNPRGFVEITIAHITEGVLWSVKDNGIGIVKEEQDRIFERFYRVDKSHSRATGGTGLGLSIVKHGAKLHQAKIELSSRIGKGTTMTLKFPKSV